MEKIVCKMPEPYPEITCCGQCPCDVELIRPLLAGTNSELTSVTQYVYQHVVLDECSKEISETLRAIAIIEMRHLGLIAEAIKTMGGDPQYVNPDINCCWNSSVICYEQNLCKLLLNNLNAETCAYHAYLAIAEKVENASLCALLRRIALDEKLHIDIFTDLINCNCRKPCDNEQERDHRDCGGEHNHGNDHRNCGCGNDRWNDRRNCGCGNDRWNDRRNCGCMNNRGHR